MTAKGCARLRVRRGSEGEEAARYDEFAVPFEEGESILDALLWIRSHRDPTLAVPYSCINANACKACAIAIDGRVQYACTTRLLDGRVFTLEPLPGKTQLRDLFALTRPSRQKAP